MSVVETENNLKRIQSYSSTYSKGYLEFCCYHIVTQNVIADEKHTDYC